MRQVVRKNPVINSTLCSIVCIDYYGLDDLLKPLIEPPGKNRRGKHPERIAK